MVRHMSTHQDVSDHKFSCPHCNATLREKRSLDYHIEKKHPEFVESVERNIYECPNCPFKTAVKRRLDEHLLVHSDSDPTCKHCKATFKSKRALQDHIVKKHPEFISSVTKEILECSCCPYKTIDKHKLETHLAKHPGAISNIKLIKCEYCDDKFRKNTRLGSHIIQKHPEHISAITCKIHECPVKTCKYITTNKTNIVRHMSSHPNYKHSSCKYRTRNTNIATRQGVSNNKFGCPHCNETFRERKALDDHIVRKHPKFVEQTVYYECPDCPYKTIEKSSEGLRKNWEKGLGVGDTEADKRESFICYNCCFTALTKQTLIKHIKAGNCNLDPHVNKSLNTHANAHTANLYVCKQCSIKFSKKTNLDSHVVKQHPEIIPTLSCKVYECKVCDYKSRRKSNFQRHMLTHPDPSASNSAPHTCSECTFKTSDVIVLRKHMLKEHHRLSSNYKRSAKCKYCSAVFRNNTNLGGHILRKHPEHISEVTCKIHECPVPPCKYRTTESRHMVRHMSTHQDVSDHKFSCPHCNATFRETRTLDDHIVKKHPEFVESVKRSIYECPNCPYKTVVKQRLEEHLLVHSDTVPMLILNTCTHCKATFKRGRALEDHIVKKHPEFISSVTREVHQCPCCSYRTIDKHKLETHLVKHPDAVSRIKLIKCEYCNDVFRKNTRLGSHIIQKHPEHINAITCKIHECPLPSCKYITTNKTNIVKHMSSHPNISKFKLSSGSTDTTTTNANIVMHKSTQQDISNHKFSCPHCSETFRERKALDDHIVKKHPESVEQTVYYECPNCPYKTIENSKFDSHILTHLKSDDDALCCAKCAFKARDISILRTHMRKHSRSSSKNKRNAECRHCDAVFRNNSNLGGHILLKHPEHISEVTCKIHECPVSTCPYKTTTKNNLVKHMSTHPDVSNYKVSLCPVPTCNYRTTAKHYMVSHMKTHQDEKSRLCVHCNAIFKQSKSLDDHVLKKHPEFIDTIKRTIYDCPNCSYRTVFKQGLDQHLLVHPDAVSNRILDTCIHCEKTFKKAKTLEDHIVKKHPEFISTVTRNEGLRKYWEKGLDVGYTEADEGGSFICYNCGYTAHNKHTLMKHIKVDNCNLNTDSIAFTIADPGNVYVCTQCSKEFAKKMNLDNHVVKEHPEIIPTLSCKIYECNVCDYKTIRTYDFNRHISTHPDASVSNSSEHTCSECTFKTSDISILNDHLRKTHARSQSKVAMKCMHCNATFLKKINLDAHILNKHPEYTSTVARKIHECQITNCKYRTTIKTNLFSHMKTHQDDKSVCAHCNATFKQRRSLDDHIVKKHPEFVQFVGRIIFECPNCPYKTVSKHKLDEHAIVHSETASTKGSYKCIHCDAIVRRERTLEDHIVRKHPEFISSVTRKILKCPKCPYKTVGKNNLDKHVLIHPDMSASNSGTHTCAKCAFQTSDMNVLRTHVRKQHPRLSTKNKRSAQCKHCHAIFRNNSNLGGHILVKHPEHISEITCKIHECPVSTCNYRTTTKNNLVKHMSTHPDVSNYEVNICPVATCNYRTTAKHYMASHMKTHQDDKCSLCAHCNATFKRKVSLDDHILKKHQEFADSIKRTIYECPNCPYKTVLKQGIDQHRLVHPDTVSKRVLNTCIHCEATFKKQRTLEDHIVKKHPEFISASKEKYWESGLGKAPRRVKGKILTCYNCNHTTNNKRSLRCHITKNCTLNTGWKKSFMSTINTDPSTATLYQCPDCTYRTTEKITLDKHIVQHPNAASRYNRALMVCVHCNRTFKKKPALDDHILKKHPDFIGSITSKIYQCPNCPHRTVSMLYLNRHLVNHRHRDIKTVNCAHCDMTFSHVTTLNHHIIKTHPEHIGSITEKIYECTECTFKTGYRTHLKNHMFTHGATDNRCVHCNKYLQSKRTLEGHIVRKHPEFIETVKRKTYECPNCTYKGIDNGEYEKHILKHYGVKSAPIFMCIHCNDTFLDKFCLDEHIIRKHPEHTASLKRKIHQCAYCSYKTARKFALNKHLLSDCVGAKKNTSDNTCLHCEATFPDNVALNDHIIKDHPNYVTASSITSNVYKCTECSYTTLTKAHLTRHLATHSAATIKCQHCEAHFKQDRALDVHIVKDHPEFISSVTKLYSCSECAYTTLKKGQLNRHSATHSAAAIKCDHCGANFKQDRNLEAHIVKNHPEFISSVKRKVYHCDSCSYKTIEKLMTARNAR
ncbi:unnamed protein product [Acanthoscelides obtectus]|uniref:C2H2-type domain-containing protein n=1 Tax=Acanthoscelides obtectus TaxID=200917 RepID=A0A9P0KRJ1_ACAOB|nr:unnamed protein product [Acanthoscelides obtectus]CAK1675762.1 hypothetical protein AOBTE_LOCUS30418 [Acanthoscelides obtectus]